jgi:hypothetical protein
MTTTILTPDEMAANSGLVHRASFDSPVGSPVFDKALAIEGVPRARCASAFARSARQFSRSAQRVATL